MVAAGPRASGVVLEDLMTDGLDKGRIPEAAMTCVEESGKDSGVNKEAAGFEGETKFNGSIPSGYHTISRLVQHYDNVTMTTNIPSLIYQLVSPPPK